MNTTDLDKNCPDCAVEIGQAHVDGCSVARCLRTGQQRLICPAQDSGFHDCGQERWTGLWPGTVECRELGWFCPDGMPNFTRLARDGHWNAATARWEPGACDHSYVDHVVVDEDGPDMLRVCGTCGRTLSERDK